MAKQSHLTRILANAGTLFVWFPILAPIVFSILSLSRRGVFHFDYLMPIELFPIALLGSIFLIWVERRMHTQHKIAAWGLLIGVGVAVTGQLIAVLTGIASGAAEPTGWGWLLIILSIAIFILALIVIGIRGIFLLRYLYRTTSAQVNI